MCDFEINGVLVTKLRVVDLKEELEARGLSKSGKKDELIARLVSYLEVSYFCSSFKIVFNLSIRLQLKFQIMSFNVCKNCLFVAGKPRRSI